MSAPVLQLRGLRKAYGQRVALSALDLQIGAGEVVALLGENGAGKTTTLAMATGQLVPDAGQTLIAGHDVFGDAMAARRLLGYVAQDLLLPPYLTVAEMAAFACQVKGAALDDAQLSGLLALTGLDDAADRLIGELSHGMQRKSAWVVALVTDPRVLVLDEGLAGLDATSSAALVDEVARRAQRGLAVLWAEHDLALLAPHLHRAVVLHGGEVAERVEGDALRAEAASGQLPELMRRWTAPRG